MPSSQRRFSSPEKNQSPAKSEKRDWPICCRTESSKQLRLCPADRLLSEMNCGCAPACYSMEKGFMDIQLEGKRVLVTGSTAGIGFATARAPVTEGASVVINGRGQPRVGTAIRRIRELHPRANVSGRLRYPASAALPFCAPAFRPWFASPRTFCVATLIFAKRSIRSITAQKS
jgi:hypothetical protein